MSEDRDEVLFERLMSDVDADWPDRLLHDLARTPIAYEEDLIYSGSYTTHARADLSDRELEVLRCASHGLDMEHIADLLCISIDTVKCHLKAARYRLKAKNTTHACCLAIRQGLIE